MTRELSYTVFYETAPEGGFQVVVPAMPEIVTYAPTLEEARLLAKDAIQCHLEGLAKTGEPIPTEQHAVQEQVTVAVNF